MKKIFPLKYIFLSLLVLAVLISSCSPGGRLPCPEPGEEITTPGPGEEYVSFTIQNDMCMSVCHLLVSPNHCEYMGAKNGLGTILSAVESQSC